MMWELPADFRDGLVPAELGHRMHSAKVESDAAMTRLTATTDAHHAQNQQAMMDRANAFWERRGADFINRKAAAEAGVKKALSDVMKDGASSEQKLAAAARFSIHNATASQLEKPSNLLKTSKSLFEAHKANTEELARRKKRYGDQVEKDELAADDATLLNKLSAKDPLPNAAIAARNQLVEDLEEILNPTRDKAMERPARAVAENAALTFCARVVAGINAAHVQKDASDLAEGMPDKRIYTAAFEGMVKVLPPAFVSKLLNEQIEHDARVAGHETRDLPTNHIAQWAKPADRVVPLARKVEK